jgi:hypothetical protein
MLSLHQGTQLSVNIPIAVMVSVMAPQGTLLTLPENIRLGLKRHTILPHHSKITDVKRFIKLAWFDKKLKITILQLPQKGEKESKANSIKLFCRNLRNVCRNLRSNWLN